MSLNSKQKTLDIRGQICPSCLLLALKEVTEHADEINQLDFSILIISDDRHATATIPDAVKKMGFSSDIKKTEEGYHILISKGGH